MNIVSRYFASVFPMVDVPLRAALIAFCIYAFCFWYTEHAWAIVMLAIVIADHTLHLVFAVREWMRRRAALIEFNAAYERLRNRVHP